MIFILSSFCIAKEYDVIHWNTVSFSPSLIPQGELKNQGYSDVARNIIIQNMKNYKHNVEVGTVTLAITNLKRLEFSCFSGLNMNEERKEFVYFSEPFILSLPNELTIKKSNQSKFEKYLNPKGEIDLLQILQEDKLRFGYVDSRAYNSYVDELIKKYKSNKNSFARKGADLTKGLIYMLMLDRIDYTIEYPAMVKYNKEKFSIKEDFIQYPIVNASNLIKVYIGCNKSMNGKIVIDKIDEIIINHKNEFLNAYKKWIPKDSLKRYEKAVSPR